MLNYSAPLDEVFQALADPARRAIVERLTRGPASVSELARPFPMSLSAVVQHLQVLEASGLVRSEKVGRVRTCRIEPAALRTAEQWISERRTTWERRLARLGEFLAEAANRSRRRDDGRSVTHATFVLERTYVPRRPAFNALRFDPPRRPAGSSAPRTGTRARDRWTFASVVESAPEARRADR
jgi:DNA-binding transcriptional ArsR family regulator